MRIRRLLVAVAAVMLCTPSVSFEGAGVQARYQDTVRSQQYRSPWQKIDELAKLENPSDGNSVRALVDEVLDFPHSFGQIPPEMNTIIKERLTKAEMNYKLGLGPGAEMTDIVRIVNKLADKFRLPEYARTTPHQAEVIRFGFEIAMPAFMGVPSTQQVDETKQADSRKMSPVQASLLLLELMDTKLMSPDFQLPPDEWEKTQYGPMIEKLAKVQRVEGVWAAI